VSGQRLDKFVEKSLLRPLGMKDTHFIVPARKQKRIAQMYDAIETERRKCTEDGMYTLVPWSHPEKAPGIMSGGGGILSYEDAGMMGSARDYAHFCQMLLNNGIAPNGRRILKASTVKALWQDALHMYSQRDGRVPGWNDADSTTADFDKVGCSLLHTHLVFKNGPSGGGKPRKAQSMWMGGGGGTFWNIDARRQTVAVSFTQTLGGRQYNEDDGLGPFGDDASLFAQRAVDEGSRKHLKRAAR
jgi:CubicO group peptidase (beta-lactamase class C family)